MAGVVVVVAVHVVEVVVHVIVVAGLYVARVSTSLAIMLVRRLPPPFFACEIVVCVCVCACVCVSVYVCMCVCACECVCAWCVHYVIELCLDCAWCDKCANWKVKGVFHYLQVLNSLGLMSCRQRFPKERSSGARIIRVVSVTRVISVNKVASVRVVSDLLAPLLDHLGQLVRIALQIPHHLVHCGAWE